MSGDPIAELSARCGIRPNWVDIWGEHHTVSRETQVQLLRAMGRTVAEDLDAQWRAVEEWDLRVWRRGLDPVHVVRAGARTIDLLMRLPVRIADEVLHWQVRPESGDPIRGETRPGERPVVEQREVDGETHAAYRFNVPVPDAWGYHALEIVSEDRQLTSALVVAPAACYLPLELEREPPSVWGAGLQLYALRSARNWGIGDFTDLGDAAAALAGLGAGLIGVNPLHAAFPHEPEKASPYGPSSRLHTNLIYLDVEAIPELARCAEAQARLYAPAWQAALTVLRAQEYVDYDGVARAKREILELLFEFFRQKHLEAPTEYGRELLAFRRAGGQALERQALYDALQEHLYAADPECWGWPVWPERFRDPASEAVKRFTEAHAERITFFVYLQWHAERQLTRAADRAAAHGASLYLDLAVGPDPGGAEVWSWPGLFAPAVSVGAPPDDFSPSGQSWGLPPWIPDRLRELAYAPFVAALRAAMRHAGVLRLDHVMGLMRLFWIPAGAAPHDGAYVHYPFEDLLAILALESHRQQCAVVGEDLGTVPDEVRAALGPGRVLSYRLFYFERDAAGQLAAPGDYPPGTLAAVSTHDLPTLAGFWKGRDLSERTELGLFPDDATRDRCMIGRAEDRTRILLALQREGLLPPELSVDPAACPDMTDALAAAIHAYVARAPATIAMVLLEDLAGELEQVNLPGTDRERPNWRRRLPLPIEQLVTTERARSIIAAMVRGRGAAATARPARDGPDDAPARIPRATYRVQFNRGFRFTDAEALVVYLDALGVSDLYASPYLRARPGSMHGYDIVEHDALNPEIGSPEDLRRLSAVLRERGMGQLLDVVPNHMGVGSDNPWWMDVLENGQAARTAEYFDIDWNPLKEALRGKVLLPVLGGPYGEVLARGELALELDVEAGRFFVTYFDHRLAVDPRTYPLLLRRVVARLVEHGSPDAPEAVELASLATAFANLPARDTRDPERIAIRRRDAKVHRRRLARLARELPAVRDALVAECTLEEDRVDRLHDLLEAQAYRLAHWRTASDEINYRRFFDINELAGLRMESAAVFFATHRRVTDLVARGDVAGLRIDHPDGLFDPAEYFARLQQHVAGTAPAADRSAAPRRLYVLVEKILARHERLDESWPVHGTTGYDFANLAGGLLVDPSAERAFDRIYARFIGRHLDADELLYERKKLIMRTALAGELAVLADALDRISEADPKHRDFTRFALRTALMEIVACFPVYRTYVTAAGAGESDRRYVQWAVARATKLNPATDPSVFAFVRRVLLREDLDAYPEEQRLEVVRFAMRFQQYTAPVMAKGSEDTTFYVYNRLVCLNEVGGEPQRFGTSVAAFHRANQERARSWPHAMLSTSTHDSKRSEDVRARLAVLSEVPQTWRQHLARWSRLGRGKKRDVDGVSAPSRNDEYLLYQTLLGAWPLEACEGPALEAFRARIEAYMIKAVREAKVHTSWLVPNEAYEAALTDFIRALLRSGAKNAFLADFVPITRRIARWGLYGSLTQTLLKLVCPGVPDIYRGCETWDFSLVDPDNRRPVEFEAIAARLYAMRQSAGTPETLDALAREVSHSLEDGRAKLFLIWRLLEARRRLERLFYAGEYLPLATGGSHADHLVALGRRHAGTLLVAVGPRWLAKLADGDVTAPGELDWADTWIELPAAGVYESVLTAGRVDVPDAEPPRLPAVALFASFPVAAILLRSP